MEMTVDTRRLWEMLQELEPKRQAQALRGGIRRAASEVRRAAVRNLKGSGLNAPAEVQKGIRTVVYKRIAGFKVTVGTKKRRATSYAGMSRGEANKAKARNRLPIVPLWAEGGTVERRTGGGWFSRGKRRGRMPAYGFMEKTKRETGDSVAATIGRNMESNIEKTVRKYGGRLS